MEPSQNSNNKKLPFQLVKTIKQKKLELFVLEKEYEVKKECARQHYLVNDECIHGFKKEDFTFSLAELINHRKITISFDQEELDLRSMKINIIYSLTLQTIPYRHPFISQLYLCNNLLAKLPNSVNKLANLRWLFLSNNQISKLHNSIGQLTKLRKLTLDNNNLSKLPDSMSKLVNLDHLDLSDNLLSEEKQEKIRALFPNTKIRLANQQEDSHA